MRTLIILAVAAGLGACINFEEDPYPKTAQGQSQAREAEREATRRCPTGEVTRRGRAVGTSPSDYDCERPDK